MSRAILSEIFLLLFGTSDELLQPMGGQRHLECSIKGALTSVHAQGHGELDTGVEEEVASTRKNVQEASDCQTEPGGLSTLLQK